MTRTGLPGDVVDMVMRAHAHKAQVAHHRRRLRAVMEQLRRRCRELGIPVPPITKTQSSHKEKQSDHSTNRHAGPG